ncbi:AbiH family protein [Pedobacter sp. R20-19]
MPALYIIGNGFDLFNGLKTSYSHFHRFVTGNYHSYY